MKKIKNKLPSGSVRVQRVLGKDENGKRIVKSFTAANKREADRIADQYVALYKRSGRIDTLSDAVKGYIDARSYALSPTTITGYKSALKLLTEKFPSVMEKALHDVNSEDIQGIINTLLSEKLSNKTVTNRVLLVISAIEHYGVHVSGYKLPAKVRPDLYVPTDEEMQILFVMASKTIRAAIYLAAFGPLRAGEILGLRDDAISGNVVHVYRTMYYTGSGYAIKEIPKTYSSNRFIEMPAFVMEYIRENGLPDLNLKLIDYQFQKLRQACFLPHFRFHDLRHWCISTLHAQGMPDQYIMQRSGHGSVHTLQNVYRHTLADQDKVMTQKAITHFNRFVV